MFEEIDPFFSEEPVALENIDEMAIVGAAINIPLAAGERLYTRWAFSQLMEEQAVVYTQPDLCTAAAAKAARSPPWPKPATYASCPTIRTAPFRL